MLLAIHTLKPSIALLFTLVLAILPGCASPQAQTDRDKIEPPESTTPPPQWQEKAKGVLRPLGETAQLPPSLGFDEQLWGQTDQSADRDALLQAIDDSLQYLQTSAAEAAYQKYPIPEITRSRVQQSLERFRMLVLNSKTPAELQASVFEEFVLYQSIGKKNSGEVLFTAYFEPIYTASPVPTPEYRYPLYRRPPNLEDWSLPHPTREMLEGANGLQGDRGRLKGLELFWLKDRLEAYQIHIQGSARLQLTDGTETTVGYADNTRHNYTSIGRELVEDGKLSLDEAKMPGILQYFRDNPQELDVYIPRDRSFVFFQENDGVPAMGSINVTLTPERSIATDKTLMPPGALALIHTAVPVVDGAGVMEESLVSRYVLDQDTGGAIQGPGRVDYFLGAGQVAGDRAGVMVSEGQLYYLLLKGE